MWELSARRFKLIPQLIDATLLGECFHTPRRLGVALVLLCADKILTRVVIGTGPGKTKICHMVRSNKKLRDVLTCKQITMCCA